MLYDPGRESVLMTYRRRRPRGEPDDRGYECGIAESRDGVHFTELWTLRKEQLGSTSLERFNLHRDADGRYLLYTSYEHPEGRPLADRRAWQRVTEDEPWLASPHAPGSLRYPDAVELDGEWWLYYEYARPDGSHELRLNRVPAG